MASQTSELDDALARAGNGDEAGFLELWRALQPRLLRFLRVVGCDDADDVASETWLQVVRDLHNFTGGEEEFRRWLFTIGRHRAIDAARARSRRPVDPFAVGLDIMAGSQDVEDQVLDGMSVRHAVALLAGLSRDQAEAVALRVIAGLDTPDVAKILGKSAGAIRVAVHRGLKALAADPSVRALAHRAAATRSVAMPPVAGPPLTGPPLTGPPLTGPPLTGPPLAGPPLAAPPLAGRAGGSPACRALEEVD